MLADLWKYYPFGIDFTGSCPPLRNYFVTNPLLGKTYYDARSVQMLHATDSAIDPSIAVAAALNSFLDELHSHNPIVDGRVLEPSPGSYWLF